MKANKSIIRFFISVFCGLFFFIEPVTAQTFANTDFEYGVYKSQPRKWSIEGEGDHYSATLDSSISYHGKKSLHVTLLNAEVFIFLPIPGNLVSGKTVDVSARYRSASPLLKGMLLSNSPADKKTTILSNADTTQHGWQLLSGKTVVSPSYPSDRLLLALSTRGTGEIWLDDVRIMIDGKPYGDAAPDFIEPGPDEIAKLNKRIIEIKDPKQSSGTPKLPLNNLLAGNRILALGENSHGSGTIYQIKLDLLKQLVEQQHYNVFALEMPTVEADKINKELISGSYNNLNILKNLSYEAWQTKEMLNTLDWIASYNATHKRKIIFRGFDMQDGTSALQELGAFSQVHDPVLREKIAQIAERYNQSVKSLDDLGFIHHEAEEVSAYIVVKTYPGISFGQLEIIRHYAEIFTQSAALKHDPSQMKSRDVYMGENINWIVNHSGSGTKVVVSADNTHISKASGKMGAVLAQLYGKEYLATGFTYNTGSYTAIGPEKYYQVHPSYPGTYEYLFSKARLKHFIIDLRKATDIPLLSKPAGFRSIGSRPQETTQFAEINLMSHFDMVVYTEQSEHTTKP